MPLELERSLISATWAASLYALCGFSLLPKAPWQELVSLSFERGERPEVTSPLLEVNLCQADRQILRRLAGRVAELAQRPCEDQKRELWYRHNALEATRPVIFCDPENGWNEIIPPESLECEHSLARAWEMQLRKEIFWGEKMGDDKVVDPTFEITYTSTDTGWGMPIKRISGGQGGSYSWDPPLKDYADMDKLRAPQILVDREQTLAHVELATEVFGDLLPVRIRGFWWWSLGMTEQLIYIRGLEQALMDMCLYPDELHQLMAFLRDAYMAKLDFLEKEGLLTPNHDGPYVGSGGFGYTRELPQKDFDGKHWRACDLWGFAESQETTSVSPEMFEEFIFPYQQPLLARFGLNCYGCCEPLHLRWHVVKRFERLRRVSVSPWADLAAMAENLGANYVYSMKPNPSYLARPEIDEEFLRKSLREAMAITRDCRVEIVMKDNHTIGHNPQNVIRWCQIAREEAERL